MKMWWGRKRKWHFCAVNGMLFGWYHGSFVKAIPIYVGRRSEPEVQP